MFNAQCSTFNIERRTSNNHAHERDRELRNYARDHVSHFKYPQKIRVVPELPKTAAGKVQKYILRGRPAISKQ
jgi:acyl-coenzyme A synthetase/AMP-(fatty) acid ligase